MCWQSMSLLTDTPDQETRQYVVVMTGTHMSEPCTGRVVWNRWRQQQTIRRRIHILPNPDVTFTAGRTSILNKINKSPIYNSSTGPHPVRTSINPTKLSSPQPIFFHPTLLKSTPHSSILKIHHPCLAAAPATGSSGRLQDGTNTFDRSTASPSSCVRIAITGLINGICLCGIGFIFIS
ncbi:uncharacterized protein LY89DRAFT_488227 [Mollisia scopiformis]|uniref:Uncharacterized protein n=1 Tax=Mollisia scopiformis TaxID=149040 RepID=A0A194XGK9_MOLSC|nr:uncharacterized protein LY89DRAFT_488227 [Mollisia scopiformis]KUJ19303.1 hypothetical protein LY89DRAFT_488227 [Mollisia scopiformis]